MSVEYGLEHPSSESGRTAAAGAVATENVGNFPLRQHSLQFACLYTKHKTQRRKIWQDGRILCSNSAVVLYDANPAPGSVDPPIDQCELSRSQMHAILQGHETRIETEKFIVSVEGPWIQNTSRWQKNPPAAPSTSMNKVIAKKFQKPSRKAPPLQPVVASALTKRKRPIQPGELYKEYYGDVQPLNSHTVAQRQPLAPPSGNHHTAHPAKLPQPGVPRNLLPPNNQPPPSFNEAFSQSTLQAVPNDDRLPTHSPTRPINSSSTLFVSNGFNPSSFYGEEGLNDDDYETEEMESELPFKEIRCCQESAIDGQNEQKTSSLSTNELLNLFGAVLPEAPSEAGADLKSQNNHHDNDFTLPSQGDTSSEEE